MAIHEANHNNNQDVEGTPNNSKEFENERASPGPGGEDDMKMEASSPEITSSPAKTTGRLPFLFLIPLLLLLLLLLSSRVSSQNLSFVFKPASTFF